MKVLGVIPARFASRRLPGKPLVNIDGKPLIQRVWENMSNSSLIDLLIVATDTPEIVESVQSFGGNCILTSPKCNSGTDRVAEVSSGMESEIVVNIQGDEPFLQGWMVDRLIETMINKDHPLSTIITSFINKDEFDDPNVVKVVCDKDMKALYFSRAPIPYAVNEINLEPKKHVGIYAYKRDILLKLSRLPPTPLEETEKLEQLRALDNGIPIYTVFIDEAKNLISVDTQEDLQRVEQVLKGENLWQNS
ncbi:3-deoxy-manno-octulosonate cytidylyltransferase [bacterium]|nr:3-deoxy-manno-octulosonate cytidylyltransferase [bacterium]